MTVAEQIDPLLRAAALTRMSRGEQTDAERAHLLRYIGRALDVPDAIVAHVPPRQWAPPTGLWAPPSDEIVSHYLTDEEMARGLFRDRLPPP